MKPNFINWISMYGLLLLFTACEDHRIPSVQRLRIKTVRTIIPGLDDTRLTTETYNYDSKGRLIQYVSGTETKPVVPIGDSSRTVINYDGQGRIENIFTEGRGLVNTASGVVYLWRPSFNTTYAYDGNGNITVMKLFAITQDRSQSPNLLEVLQFEYDGTKFPVKVIHTTTSNNHQWTERYTYSGDNIVNVESSDNQSATTTYQYDNKPNPFYGLLTGEKRNDAFIALNKNNVMTNDKQYLYDTNGLLSKVIAADGVVYTYEYEAY
ncbi:hypothetical protein [Spirosoma humi]